ncbi:MAG: hypothetical protein JW940_12315 [Polyangiaceae bacterium]|nr:hypothetical protein [Polyangiaceae bacterium]
MDSQPLGRIGAWICALLLVSLAAWIGLMAVQGATISPDWQMRDFVIYVAGGAAAHVASYLNATVFTLLAVMLFALLVSRFRTSHPILAVASLVLVPIYGVMNTLAYASQFTMAPELARQALSREDETALLLAAQLIHAYPGSLVGWVNALAYALLGIPSILMAVPLWQTCWRGRAGAGFLAASAGASLAGCVGMAMHNDLLGFGTLLGGLLFTLAVVFLLLFFAREWRGLPS